ncbi:hypothetical protein EmuJ_001024600 [Echinococcus multilocularis]|uniref:Uncharacterized protein n=1 Tax=Echinococcus multilocularis TaxID=6211 RepID=A0A068YK40_ECHMU|nr:hypothetical protein EmuJ_001024600 [Echinococcus multilocularis]
MYLTTEALQFWQFVVPFEASDPDQSNDLLAPLYYIGYLTLGIGEGPLCLGYCTSPGGLAFGLCQ